jgi:hypothetical protein
MIEPAFEEFENFNSFNPEEDAYIFNYNTPFTYNYDSYISECLYYIDGSNKEISDIEDYYDEGDDEGDEE